MKQQDHHEKLYLLAKERFETQNYKGAIEAFKSLLKDDFKDRDSHFFLALSYEKDQQHELALEHLLWMQKCFGDDATLLKHLAYNYSQLGHYKEAIYKLQQALHLFKQDHEAYKMLAENYLAQNELRYAKKVLEEAIAIAPKISSYYIELARVLVKLKAYDDAERVSKKALALSEDASAYMVLGILYDEQQRYDAALTAYDKAIALSKGWALAYNNRGIALSKLGERAKAIKALKKALKLAPENRSYSDNLKLLQGV